MALKHVFNFTHNKRNANENYTKIPFLTLDWQISKTLKIYSLGEAVETVSHITENANWHNLCWRKSANIYTTMYALYSNPEIPPRNLHWRYTSNNTKAYVHKVIHRSIIFNYKI